MKVLSLCDSDIVENKLLGSSFQKPDDDGKNDSNNQEVKHASQFT